MVTLSHEKAFDEVLVTAEASTGDDIAIVPASANPDNIQVAERTALRAFLKKPFLCLNIVFPLSVKIFVA